MNSMQMPAGTAKRAMQVFVGLLVVNALIAIAAVLGAAGDSEWKVVGTTLLLTAACLTIAANAAALERNRLRQLPLVAVGLSCLAFAIFIVLIWVEPDSDADGVFRFTFIVLTLGLATTYASLLAIPDLAGSFLAARSVGYGAAAILATLIVVAILVEEGGPAELYAVLCIVLATATIIVLTGAIVGSRSAAAVDPVDAAPVPARSRTAMYCPSCAAVVGLYVTAGHHQCSNCGLGFHLDITAPPTS